MNVSVFANLITQGLVPILTAIVTVAILCLRFLRFLKIATLYYWKKYVVTTFLKLYALYMLLDILTEAEMGLEKNCICEASLVDVTTGKSADVTHVFLELENKTFSGFVFSIKFGHLLEYVLSRSKLLGTQNHSVFVVVSLDDEGVERSTLLFPLCFAVFPIAADCGFADEYVEPQYRLPGKSTGRKCDHDLGLVFLKDNKGYCVDITDIAKPFECQICALRDNKATYRLRKAKDYFVMRAIQEKLIPESTDFSEMFLDMSM
jgi:hypothetical protein